MVEAIHQLYLARASAVQAKAIAMHQLDQTGRRLQERAEALERGGGLSRAIPSAEPGRHGGQFVVAARRAASTGRRPGSARPDRSATAQMVLVHPGGGHAPKSLRDTVACWLICRP